MNVDGATIARATRGRLVRDGGAGPVGTDTRSLTPGSWFLAIVGDRFDGHAFLDVAREAGAAGCIVDRDPGPAWHGGVIVVDDTTRALQDLGRYARDQFSGPVVGVTGSSGKTTTRTLIALALGPLGPIHHTAGNLNNHLGVPLTLLAVPDDAVAMVVEMGTSAPGEIAFLAEMVRPEVRLIVNIGPAHLEELGGLEGVAVEKGALFASARPGDLCCVNEDDPRVAALPLGRDVGRVAFGSSSGTDGCPRIVLEDVSVEPASLSTVARFLTPEGPVEATIPAPGRHVALDAAGALAVAVALGLDPRASAAALSGYAPVGMRMRPEALPSGAIALNDAYNANPQSMAASLEVLAAMPGRRVAVLGDMLEMGPEEATWHRQVARIAGGLDLDWVVLVGPRMAEAASACGARRVDGFPDAIDAVEPLRQWLAPGDVVLLKGSRGARVERVLQGLQAGTSEGSR